MTKCVRAYYRGRVQGVGFRVTARALAARFAVAGYVKNLPDGQVELLAEGEGAEIERYLAALEEALHGNIVERRTEEVVPDKRTRFEITYD